MLNLTEHELSTANKQLYAGKLRLFPKLLVAAFIPLTNVKMPTIVGILTFISIINFVLAELIMKRVL